MRALSRLFEGWDPAQDWHHSSRLWLYGYVFKNGMLTERNTGKKWEIAIS